MCRGASRSGPNRLPLPFSQSYNTHTQSHTGRVSERRGCSCAHRNAGKWENIAPGKSYNEFSFQKQFNPCPAEIENASVEDPQLKHNLLLACSKLLLHFFLMNRCFQMTKCFPITLLVCLTIQHIFSARYHCQYPSRPLDSRLLHIIYTVC